MRTADFDYYLPKKFIAQNPVSPRDACKLLIYDCKTDKIFHKKFFEIGDFLRSSDILVLNRSKVIPARIIFTVNGHKKEIFLLRRIGENSYQVLVRPGRNFKLGSKFIIDPQLKFTVKRIFEDGSRSIKFIFDKNVNLKQKLFSLGKMPLPPYITHSKAQFFQYQTVYAKEEGSTAAPTAGLHFTKKLLNSLKKNGVKIEEILLHVGLGTFAPVITEKIEDHIMHSEEFELSKDVADNLNFAKRTCKRIIAVGTTSVRVLETNYVPNAGFKYGAYETDIFIYPGKYKWKAVDALITNFHLPKSTLIMLVSSFLENKGVKDPIKKLLTLYEIAKKKNYRFYSFGDAMFIF